MELQIQFKNHLHMYFHSWIIHLLQNLYGLPATHIRGAQAHQHEPTQPLYTRVQGEGM
jgi:hypothetical protein